MECEHIHTRGIGWSRKYSCDDCHAIFSTHVVLDRARELAQVRNGNMTLVYQHSAEYPFFDWELDDFGAAIRDPRIRVYKHKHQDYSIREAGQRTWFYNGCFDGAIEAIKNYYKSNPTVSGPSTPYDDALRLFKMLQ